VLGWTTRAGYASEDGRIHINAQGLRATRGYDELVPRGVRRVIACGESFTFGEEVADGEAWAARLEALVPALEVLNYGVGGYGTDQALLRVSREAHAPADVLLVGVMIENIGRNVNRYRPLWYPSGQPAAKPRYVVGAHGLELVPQPFASQAEFVAAVGDGSILARMGEHEYWAASYLPPWLAWSLLARAVAARRAYADRALEPLWSDTTGEPYRTTLGLLEALRGTAQGLAATRYLVLVFPTREEFAALFAGGPRSWSTLTRDLDERGIESLDLSDALLEAARTSGPDSLYGKSHFTPQANDVVARAIAARLAQAAPVPEPK
jgi:hypothetical protein